MYIPLTFEGALQKCIFATGGDEGYFISGSDEYKFHYFTSSANLIVDKGTIDNVQIYVIGGGGGGAAGTANVSSAGGGGGGGVEYLTNARLYKGTYTISVGKGGAGAVVQNSSGFAGVGSSFIGQNISIIANAGQGGTPDSDGAGGASGNGFAGGLNTGGNGGGGGGATANGNSGTSTKAGDGGSGVTIENVNNSTIYSLGYGCGGGGYAPSTSDTPGYSCNGFYYGAGGEGDGTAGDGANGYGMGGGGGYAPGTGGGDGGSGSVIIKYKVYDYCTDYFNKTGNCGCGKIVLDIVDPFNAFEPYGTGSVIYTPCGQTGFVSSSIDAFFPETICVASGSLAWYNYLREDSNPNNRSASVYVYDQNQTAPGCFNSIYGVQTCTTQSVPTSSCSQESIVTFYASGSGGPVTAKYFPAHSSSFAFESIPTNSVRYRCVQSGSIIQLGTPAFYPIQMSGSFAEGIIYYTASCNIATFTATWNGVGVASSTATFTYTACGGSRTQLTLTRNATSGITARSASVCIDMNIPTTNTRFGLPIPSMVVTYGGSCLSGSFDTASCGCS